MKQMETIKLALIGECMIELQEFGPDDTRQTFGGDTLNTAIYSARLADSLPLEIDYVTALGCDSFSQKMMRFWEQEGVGSSLVQTVQGQHPGLYYIELDDEGERVFHYWRSDSAARKCFDFPGSEAILRRLSAYQAVYLSGISLAILTPTGRTALISRLQELAREGISIFFDCNFRPSLWDSVEQAIDFYEQLYRISRVVFLTTEEAEQLLGCVEKAKAHELLHRYGVEESVVKDGARPCSISRDKQVIEVAAVPAKKVVDTTAAGDSFSAVYLVARCFGCSTAEAAKLAHKTAAYVVGHKGALAPKEKMPVTGQDIASIIYSSGSVQGAGELLTGEGLSLKTGPTDG